MKNTEYLINLTAIVPSELAEIRLDQALAKLFPDYSRSKLQKWIEAKYVTVNGQAAEIRYKTQTGDNITITAPAEKEVSWQAHDVDLNIVYEDEHLIVINKPIGLVVHPGAGHQEYTLVNALLHHCPALANLPRAGLIHRLDKDTSGLLVIAKTLSAHTLLIQQMQNREIHREYNAIVNGVIIAGGTVDAPMGRHHTQRKKMTITASGKPAITHYRVIEKFRAHTWLKVQLETGRTHQIRVHMTHINHPILGDKTYGGRIKLPPQANEILIQALRAFDHQALHAKRLELIHPITHKKMSWQAPLPKDMERLIELLREDSQLHL